MRSDPFRKQAAESKRKGVVGRSGMMIPMIARIKATIPIVMRIIFLNLVEDFIKSLADRCFRVPGRTAIDA